jgi:TPR repeat protein
MDETPLDLSQTKATHGPLELTETLASRGDANAQFSVGLRYATKAKEPDYAQAADWYLKAAHQNHAMAQFNLGIMYGSGQGVTRDQAQSMKWLLSSAQLGDAAAQFTVGLQQNRISMSEAPEAAKESKIEAYKWLQLAAAQGYRDSESGSDLVAMGMTREGVIEGRRRATIFVPGAQHT